MFIFTNIQITCLKQEVSFEILILNATFARNFFIDFIFISIS